MRTLRTSLLLLLVSSGVACGEKDVDGDGSPESVDCDDNNAAVKPDGIEICDGLDNNCDGFVDEDANVTDAPSWYLDRDTDGFGDDDVVQVTCERPGGGWTEQGGDCDDTNPIAAPGNIEQCNGFDDDCDGTEDEPEDADDAEIWYEDWDFDSFGDPDSAQLLCPTQVPRLWVQNGDDCNDRDNQQYPGADEFCNDADDDCDGAVDELAEVVDGFDAWLDADRDGYGNPTSRTFVCTLPDGYVTNGSDCKDGDDLVALGCGCTDGSGGELVVARGTTRKLPAGEHFFTNVTVEAGATLRFEGLTPVWLFAETVTVDGVIDVAAKADKAGPGGGGGGSGANCYSTGGKGGNAYLASGVGGAGGGYPYSTGGGGGGSADPGDAGLSGSYGAGGAGGDRFGDISLETAFAGGGGGGGGGANGGVGGGGGGAIKIVAGEIDVAGTIDARGGDGGRASTTYCYYGGGGGGGGAGGMVWLHGDRVTFTGSILLDGGTYGTGVAGSYYYYEGTAGGAGSVGRARVSGKVLINTGEVTDIAYSDKADPTCDTPLEEE